MESSPASVIIVGAGPVGMLLAYQLDRLGVDCLIAEQSLSTTQWPKMDLTNCRTMEILRVLGLADDYRAQQDAVGPDANFDSVFLTSLEEGARFLGDWKLPSVNEHRERIKQCNDGTQPAEPGQRCSQIIFEAWLRKVISRKPRITLKTGWKFTGHTEECGSVIATFVDQNDQIHSVRGRYLAGCDGAGSNVRKSAGIRMLGGQMSLRYYLVHFRSRDLAQKFSHRRFWHAFPVGAGFLIDQDEKDTFTVHYPLQPGDRTKYDPQEIVYKTLGGYNGRWPIEIDEILVHSEWQPNFYIVEKYCSDSGRVLLAGDAAHRNPPHGAFGMNSGAIDAITLGWRLAAVVKGYGGKLLLQAYGTERRPWMIRTIQRSHRHVMEHVVLAKLYQDTWDQLDSSSQKGAEVRAVVKKFINHSESEVIDRGLELDLRYDSPIIYQDGTLAPVWHVRRYEPSTRPGSRVPHVFLKDGVTSTYDLFAKEWTMLHFVSGNDENPKESRIFSCVAAKLALPLTIVKIHDEDHVREILESNLVLVRPDTHVAWRSDKAPTEEKEVEHILSVVSGRLAFPGYIEREQGDREFLDLVTTFN